MASFVVPLISSFLSSTLNSLHTNSFFFPLLPSTAISTDFRAPFSYPAPSATLFPPPLPCHCGSALLPISPPIPSFLCCRLHLSPCSLPFAALLLPTHYTIPPAPSPLFLHPLLLFFSPPPPPRSSLRPPHCCIIQTECYLEWLVFSLSTSPLIALHGASHWSLTPSLWNPRLPQTHTQITHTCTVRSVKLVYSHTSRFFAFGCFPAHTKKNVKKSAHLSCHTCSSLLFSFLFLPQIPARGPQRSLKQQLQADAGPDYNRTRRLLFIATSSTTLKHINYRRHSLTTQSRDKVLDWPQ